MSFNKDACVAWRTKGPLGFQMWIGTVGGKSKHGKTPVVIENGVWLSVPSIALVQVKTVLMDCMNPTLPHGHKPIITAPPLTGNMQRQWVRCPECRNVAYYDYIPRGLSTPIRYFECGHGVGAKFEEFAEYITATEVRKTHRIKIVKNESHPPEPKHGMERRVPRLRRARSGH